MKFRRKKIIIGIHGIGNKPSKPLLRRWWIRSINDGLKSIGYPGMLYNFELVYWVDLMYSKPLNPRIKDKKHLLYMERPYVRPPKIREPGKKRHSLRKKILDHIEKRLDKIFYKDHIFINYDLIADIILRRLFKDLDFYYHKKSYRKTRQDKCAKDAIRERLVKVLTKHRRKNILLIAHSMGSVVAFDVLSGLVPDVQISTLVTMGSPLGFPVIKKKILAEQSINDETNAVTPENIKHNWFNFSDINDKIAVIYELCDEYKENSCKVGPVDFMVNNTYEYKGVKSHHKSYGYLRSPEVAETIHEFLTYKKFDLFKFLQKYIKNILKKKSSEV